MKMEKRNKKERILDNFIKEFDFSYCMAWSMKIKHEKYFCFIMHKNLV